MEINKKIAKHALSFIGGKPQVFQYNSSDESKNVDVMTCRNGQYRDIDVFATIGLANQDIGLFHENRKLRVELMAVGPVGDEDWANIIASAAFEVMDQQECGYGTIIPNIVSGYKKASRFPHLLLLSPNYWQSYTPLKTDDLVVVWLLAVPISDSEQEHILKNGVEDFERALEESQVNIWELNRQLLF